MNNLNLFWKRFDPLDILKIVYVFLCFCGIIFYLFPFSRQISIQLTELFVGLTAIGVIIVDLIYHNKSGSNLPENNYRKWGWLGIVFIATFLIEAYGTATGLIFGNYRYSDLWKLKILDTPIIIGINWIFVILAGLAISNLIVEKFVRFFSPKIDSTSRILLIIRSLLVGIFAVGYDLILEKIAIKHDYWFWPNDFVPMQNYISWAIIATLGAGIFLGMKLKLNPNKVSFGMVAYFSTLVYFVILLSMN